MKYVLYVNVGNISKLEAVEYANSVKDQIIKEDFLNSNDKILAIPVRDRDTELCVLTLE